MQAPNENTMMPPLGATPQAPAPASRAAAALLAATLAFTALPAVDPVSILLPPAHAEEEVADVSGALISIIAQLRGTAWHGDCLLRGVGHAV